MCEQALAMRTSHHGENQAKANVLEPPTPLVFVQEASVPYTSHNQRRQLAQHHEELIEAVIDTPEVSKSAMA